MVEDFKIINGFAPPIMEDFFLFRENTHNIRNFQIISNESKKTVRYGLETVKYRTTVTVMGKFTRKVKTKIKTWKCETCVFRLCQTYHQNLVFL